MKAYLMIEGPAYRTLMTHLLPPDSHQEQAAFLFAHTQREVRKICFAVAGFKLLWPEDFTVQESDYLAMADSTRAGLIKQAHDMAASLIEIHSHPGPWAAAFSLADREGLRETVPPHVVATQPATVSRARCRQVGLRRARMGRQSDRSPGT